MRTLRRAMMRGLTEILPRTPTFDRLAGLPGFYSRHRRLPRRPDHPQAWISDIVFARACSDGWTAQQRRCIDKVTAVDEARAAAPELRFAQRHALLDVPARARRCVMCRRCWRRTSGGRWWRSRRTAAAGCSSSKKRSRRSSGARFMCVPRAIITSSAAKGSILVCRAGSSSKSGWAAPENLSPITRCTAHSEKCSQSALCKTT